MTSAVRAFAPATVSNVGPGFDVLGFALEAPGDEVEVGHRDRPGVEIVEVAGDGGRLPTSPDENTAGVAVKALLAAAGSEEGVAITLRKGMPLRSGLGSSAASGVAAAVAADRLLGLEAPRELLLRCAMEGERAACGAAHADNAAPSLYGGFVLVRSHEPPDVVVLAVPEGLSCAVVRPHLEVETRGAREALGESVSLRDAVTQWANVGALVAALFQGDLELLAHSVHDAVAEPKRAGKVPGFAKVKSAAREAGALGCSLSGSGPSLFAFSASREEAAEVAAAMAEAFAAEGVAADRIVSRVGASGARVLDDGR